MCGIAGWVSFDPESPVDSVVLERMGAAIAHRGPDDTGSYLHPRRQVGFAFRRLSIIDLAGGHQPMSNEDGRIHLVFNGEIYNFEELRRALLTRGHRFRSRSDAETVVHQYEDSGPECLHALNGMFAFGLWDDATRTLILARDRLGKKPLYYRHAGRTLLFASEIKALLAHPGTPRAIDPDAIEGFLAFQYVPPPLTMFHGIRQLPPGHCLLFDGQGLRVERWWKPAPSILEDMDVLNRRDDLEQEVFSCLFASVKRRMVADVPVGTFLSGGLDSSIVTGLATLATSERVRTFSIGFEEDDFNELPHARRVAEHFKTDHHEFLVRPDAVALLPTLVWHYDQPFADSSAIPTWYLARMTREKVKVVLTGDAGDECFLGYPRYAAGRMAARLDVLPAWLRRGLGWLARGLLTPFLSAETRSRKRFRVLSSLHLPAWRRYLEWISVFDADARRRLLVQPPSRDAALFAGGLRDGFLHAPMADAEGRAAFADLLTYLPGDLLTKVDVATMAHGLEARCPFLDPEVVGLALAIPSAFKSDGLEGKRILKDAFASLLPPETLARGKQGFGVPLAKWFRGPLRGMVSDLLLDVRARQRGIFDPQIVERVLAEHLSGRADHSHPLWSLLVFEVWHRVFIDQTLTPARDGG